MTDDPVGKRWLGLEIFGSVDRPLFRHLIDLPMAFIL